MSKKIFIKKTDFKEQTPEMLVGEEKESLLYKKAFLSREDEVMSEFAQNTTTWD